MNIKKELKWQYNQLLGMFDGFGLLVAEMLILGFVGVMMVLVIFTVFYLLAKVF